MKHPEHEDMNVPSLHKDIKAMNGKSSKRLAKSIDELSELLDENNRDEEATDDNDAGGSE